MKKIFALLLALSAGFFYRPSTAHAQPVEADFFRQEGIASWYGPEFDGRPTASGEIFNSALLTAAHPNLPFGTIVVVTNRNNGRSVQVRINDRGPFVHARIIDVSRAAAEHLDMIITGTAPVVVESVDRITMPQGIRPGGSAAPAVALAPAAPDAPIFSPPPPAPVSPPTSPPQPIPPPAMAAGAQPQFVPPPAGITPGTLDGPIVVPHGHEGAFGDLPQQFAQPQQFVQPIPEPAPAQQFAQPAFEPAQPQPQQFVQPVVPAPQPQFVPPPQQVAAPPPAVLPAAGRAALTPAITPSPTGVYRLQVGSYRVARNAVGAFERLRDAGLSPAYERSGEFFRVVLAGIPGHEVDFVTQRIWAAGFSEAIIRSEN